MAIIEVAVVRVDWEEECPWRDAKTDLCERVPRGEKGELLYRVHAQNVQEKFAGYLGNEEASRKKILRDAWFWTGDVVSWDAEGWWWFSDRIGDTFRWKSENVSTSEVAEVLGPHPAVLEANVYGVEIPRHDGRAGCAAVLLEERPEEGVLDGIVKHVNRNLPRYAVPVFLRVVTEIIATGNNKQQRHILRVEGVDPCRIKDGDAVYLAELGDACALDEEGLGGVEWGGG